MRCLKLAIEYDGTDFVGWQIQANGRSVQGVITQALEQVLQHKITLIGAGRTDAGVHARGQVGGFRTTSSIPSHDLLRAMNGLLPSDVSVRSMEDVPMNFHPRFDARERVYRYYISLLRSPLSRRYSWYVRYSLDFRALRTAASWVLGVNDFRSFCTHGFEVPQTVCTVGTSFWEESPDQLVYEIRADRFVHGMVRALVGTMVDIARGYFPLSDFPLILSSNDRRKAGVTAPARGLVLEEVIY